MSVWSVLWRVIDGALGLAIAADERSERRKLRRQLDELGDAMGRDKQRLERTRAPTVVLPRPAPPTTHSPAGASVKPSAPSTPPRRR